MGCLHISVLELVRESRNGKIRIGLTQEEIQDYMVTPTCAIYLICLHSMHKYRVVMKRKQL